MSFSSESKDEIVRIRSRERSVKLAELSGLTFACGTLRLGRRLAVSYRTESLSVGKHIASLGGALYGLSAEVEQTLLAHKKAPLYTVSLSGERWQTLLFDTKVLLKTPEGVNSSREIPTALFTGEEEKRAFVRGCFLGCGSCTDPKRDYHAELVFREEPLAKGLAKLLEDYGIPARAVLRRGRYVTVIRDGDAVMGFLALIGSNMGALNLENVRAVKETRNYVNRTTNCEYANLDKLVIASLKQQQAAKTILRYGHFGKLPPALREAAELRLNHPDATLQELAELADIKKSGMNHRLTRLIEYAEELENGMR